ncbi:Biopolymer transport protein ExbB [Posidoniimonas corsicana]|uniref:Biopolymer transport protein ExbB n=1 Tax=Posidoniimonas corsicana TaxID=1938618 RepID=A0A5C5VEI0_9BACT|nr:MotA/TolQ/ExbB proton channel family protein [Posidoniimonas corsicana]TWT36082.1 Biopolymer transport protein ExbB [Posidoniimonas corsicana]
MRSPLAPFGPRGLTGSLSFALLIGVLATPGVALAQDGDAGNAAAQIEQMNYLTWVATSLGWGYSIVFLALSFTLVALFVMNLLQASRGNVVPAELTESFEEHLNAKQYTEAYELANADESFLGKVLSAGLGKLSGGQSYAHAIEAMQEVGEEENMKLEHRLSYMALIGTISPMIGLMGTVQGMISAFQTIATTASGAPNPSDLAGDISTALFTTLAGLMIAIPAIAAYNILRNRIARLVLEVGIVSEGLMSRFQNVGGGKKVE